MYIAIIIFFFEMISADILLTTKSGPVQGVTSQYAEDVEAFLGIPYAEPPVGDLRFSKPIPTKDWNDTLIASNMPPPCGQLSYGDAYFMPDLSNMSEDCLYLNIWIPKSNYDYGLNAIIVYIYGGAFTVGTVGQYDGSMIASRGDIIFSIINYRVGALGYFLSPLEEAPGNMGMYDQVMGIKWIKDNAEIFGGDPENIVLMGQSAGAFSVSAHMVSPLSKHLFNRAIMESGSIIQPFFFDNTRVLKSSHSIAAVVGCANDTVNLLSDPNSVVKCLKQKPLEDINEAEQILIKSSPVGFFPISNDEFLPKSAVELFREGKFRKDMEVLLGVNRDEGSFMLTTGSPEYFGRYGQNPTQTFNKNVAKLFFRGLAMIAGLSNSSEISDFYFSQVKDRTPTRYIKTVANFVGDFVIACGTVFQADILSLKGNPVYFYHFEFRPPSSPTAEWVGVSHIDELPYVYGIPFFGDNFTAQEFEFSNNLIDRWTSFARTGNPNVPGRMPWLRYSYHNPLYINFGQEEEGLRMDPLNRRCEMWRKRFKADVDTSFIRLLRNSGLNEANVDVS